MKYLSEYFGNPDIAQQKRPPKNKAVATKSKSSAPVAPCVLNSGVGVASGSLARNRSGFTSSQTGGICYRRFLSFEAWSLPR